MDYEDVKASQASPTGTHAMFQLQEMSGVIRMWMPVPTMPSRSTGSSASP